jgi:2-dehydropantoate 2-reductase
MRIAIFGSGALGALFGARLQRAGEDVTFIARGATLQALRERGIQVTSAALGDFSVAPVTASDDPQSVGPVGLVLLTVKAYDLEGTAAALRPLVGAGTLVLPVLNGVEIAERLGAVLGMEHLLGGITYTGAVTLAPGSVRHLGQDGIRLGEPSGGPSARTETVRALLERAGIPATVSDDIARDTWTKLVFFAATGGVLSLARATFGAVQRHPGVRGVFIAVMREVEAVARRKGLVLPPNVVEHGLALLDGYAPDSTSSMMRDVVAGRPLELDVVHGAVVRQGKQLGVPTPTCALIYALLSLHANGTAKS